MSGCGDRADSLGPLHDEHRGIVVAAMRANDCNQLGAAIRERHGASKHAAEHRKIRMPMHAVAAQDEHFAGAQL